MGVLLKLLEALNSRLDCIREAAEEAAPEYIRFKVFLS
jgi:hypothetical protein